MIQQTFHIVNTCTNLVPSKQVYRILQINIFAWFSQRKKSYKLLQKKANNCTVNSIKKKSDTFCVRSISRFKTFVG